MELIDVHAHVVPKEFPTGPTNGSESRWPCMCHTANNAATIEINGKAFRKLDSRSWEPAARIEDMATTGVTRQVLSPMPELLSYWFSPAAGLDMCRWINQFIFEIASKHPNYFSGLGCVPLQDPDLAAKELSHIASSGGLGVEVGSNVNGQFLGEPQFEAFFAEAQRLNLAVFVHALHPIGSDRLTNAPDLIPFAAFPLDTGLCAMSLIRAGIPEKYPNLRIGFSHGGGAVIPLAHRLGIGAKITNNFNGTLQRSPAAYAADFFYDNLVYDPGYMSYLANEFAPGRVFCGTDYPYPIMAKQPKQDIEQAVLSDRDSMAWRAAAHFLNLEN